MLMSILSRMRCWPYVKLMERPVISGARAEPPAIVREASAGARVTMLPRTALANSGYLDDGRDYGAMIGGDDL
jgi:hypothetical protein